MLISHTARPLARAKLIYMKSQRKSRTATSGSAGRWSARVTRESRALELDEGVFTWNDPKKIAASLKRSAEQSTRRKAEPYRSALSMLVFYINRAGTNLHEPQLHVLEQAKLELKKLFGHD